MESWNKSIGVNNIYCHVQNEFNQLLNGVTLFTHVGDNTRWVIIPGVGDNTRCAQVAASCTSIVHLVFDGHIAKKQIETQIQIQIQN